MGEERGEVDEATAVGAVSSSVPAMEHVVFPVVLLRLKYYDPVSKLSFRLIFFGLYQINENRIFKKLYIKKNCLCKIQKL